MTRRRAALLAAGLAVLATAGPATAHGIGGRGDLPIPGDAFVAGAAVAVAASFLGVVFLWRRPLLAGRAAGQALPGWVTSATRGLSPLGQVLGLAAFALTLVSAWAGSTDQARNFAPVAVYVVFWVGVLWASALLGPIWRSLNPWDTIAMLAARRLVPTPDPHPPDRSIVWSHWPAAAALLAFEWLELAYYEPASTKALALAISAYSLAVLGACAVLGRRWLQTGEGFTVLFGLVAAMAPLARRVDGRVVARVPFTGLAAFPARRGTVAVLLVVLGGTTFDGLSRSAWWGSQVRLTTGWERTWVNSLGLLVVIAAVTVVYLGTVWLSAAIGRGPLGPAPARYVHALVPIALAYSVAHYFSLAVFDGQSSWRLLSDPLGRGWDLFGGAGYRVDYLLLTAGAIAAVQTAAMVVGHVAGVALAHDRALEDVPDRRRVTVSQLPVVIAMIAFTVAGLTLLLSV